MRYDTGNPPGWLEAVIELSLRDPKLGPGLREFIAASPRDGIFAGA